MVARTRSGTNSRPNNNVNTSSNKMHGDRSTPNKSHNQPLTVLHGNNNSTDEVDNTGKRFSDYPKIDQAILTMKSALGRFTRANDRRMVLRTLKEVKYLTALPVEPRPPPMVDLEELEMEVAKESLVLNGQAFHRKTKYGRTSTDFLHVLHELCYQLCENSVCPSTASVLMGGNNPNSCNESMMSVALSPDTLYYDLLCRLARTITSADCFAKLNDILGSQELILMNSSAERKPKSKKGGKAPGVQNEIPPIEVNIFEEGGNIHAHIVTTLGYGLYRKLDVNTGRPWIKMQVEMNERMNFSSGSQVRHVTIHWPDMYV